MRSGALLLICLAAHAEVRLKDRAVSADGGVVESPFPFSALGATWTGDERLVVRVRIPAGEWKFMRRGEDFDGNVADLLYFPPGTTVIEYEVTGAARDLRFHFIDPGPSSPLREAAQPGIVSRAQWGARPPVSAPAPTTPTHLIVHHTADAPPLSGDFSAWVRAIQAYHIDVNGWNDIGYNYLVSPTGLVFEGRGDGILGAHFSGANTATMGVSVLGNYMAAPPPDLAVAATVSLLAWQAEKHNIDATARALHRSSGLTLFTISGHRDGPSPTDCPGDALYPMLPSIRFRAALNWQTTGLWNATPDGFQYGDPAEKNYETGDQPNSGTVTSASFMLSQDAVLSFRSWYETENSSTLWDEKYVEISVNEGAWRALTQISGVMKQWVDVDVPLTDRGSVRLRFRFDTVDGYANGFEGWYVSNITVN